MNTLANDSAASHTSEQWAALVQYDTTHHRSNQNQQTIERQEGDHDSTLTKLPALTLSSPTLDVHRPPLEMIPSALTGGNAILVHREMERIRHRQGQQTQRRWRTIAGSMMLLVLIPNTYILAQYIYAYLALSPADWPLSKSIDGTKQVMDNLMRSLALVLACLSVLSIISSLACGIYLRLTRRSHKGQWFHLMSATITTSISLAQSVANLALIAIWHNTYSTSASPHAKMRDVSQRCWGNWSMDMLWNAASYNEASRAMLNKSISCQHNSSQVLKAYYVAGGIRLIFFVILCAIWLQCIVRYHHTLSAVTSSNEKLVESAEMHKLLQDEEKRIEHFDAEMQYKDNLIAKDEAATRLEGFQPIEDSARNIDSTEISSQGKNDISARIWSFGDVGHVWNLLRGNVDEAASMVHHDIKLQQERMIIEEEDDEKLHERQVSKLGARGWFNKDISGQDSEDFQRDEVENEQLLDHPQHSNHIRMSSQEKRAREGRHTAAHLMHIEEEGDSQEKQKRDQQDRIAYLESIGYSIKLERRQRDYNGATHEDAARRSSSAGDELPHMPELIQSRTEVLEDGIDEDDDQMYWRVTGLDQFLAHEERFSDRVSQKENLYVRALGKLIRKMSDIKSVGSQERLDRRSRSNGRSGSEM